MNDEGFRDSRTPLVHGAFVNETFVQELPVPEPHAREKVIESRRPGGKRPGRDDEVPVTRPDSPCDSRLSPPELGEHSRELQWAGDEASPWRMSGGQSNPEADVARDGDDIGKLSDAVDPVRLEGLRCLRDVEGVLRVPLPYIVNESAAQDLVFVTLHDDGSSVRFGVLP